MTAPVFLDTSAVIAAASTTDDHHAQAVVAYRALRTMRRVLVTTNYILAEAYTLARRRLGHGAAVAIADTLTSGEDIRLVHVARAQETRALALLRRQADKAYSFADATAFVVMEDCGVTEAFTFDRHFARAGLVMIPGE